MADKSNPQREPQDIRSVAETTLTKAKEAVDKVMKEASRAYEKFDVSAQAAQAGARDMNQKAIGFAEANVNAAFDFAQKLVRAKDPQEIVALHQTFLKQQGEQFSAQIRELSDTVVESAKPGS